MTTARVLSEPEAGLAEPTLVRVRPVPIVAPRARAPEPASPFVVWSDDDRQPLEPVDESESSLVLELLSAPDRVADRLLEPAELQRAVLGSLATLIAATSFFSAVMMSIHGPLTMLRAAAASSFDVLLALAAAFGPIWATSVLLAARLPLPRLIGVLVTSAATGALLLAASAPIPYFLWKLDNEWAGPLSVLGAFAISGIITGARVHHGMFALAERIHAARDPAGTGGLSADEHFRIGILARMSLVLVAFTVGLAFWALDALVVVW